ncbi:uncharacterized protein VICG_00516 [Vittaforma corneae ATCC 50505]|uniref:tRNase Z endonuclease domain-containing protein n=1 Tax=Vittaforma corneae (strain ATCC 50505) TaxID=993615 RepID=L2GQ14_VITCO|nr:uncharacterized protein VICG_00516 [Vittaforma corneae ATCC 50505]ELA42417.1 hypothetical protein VICG_00516 [Vittaforma corneae ATCC 50505]
MLISLKFISSKSGKSLALKIEDKTYLFNLFEGFQRYSIQEQFSLVSVDSIFLSSKSNISGLIGTYLTIGESSKTNLNIVSNFNTDFFLVYKYAISPTLNLTFLSEFKDEFISVKMFDWNGITNFIIALPEIKGTLHPERVPPHIPKRLYKKLISDGFLEVEDVIYKFSNFSDPGIILNDICLVFSEIGTEERLDGGIATLIENIQCFFCFTKSSYAYFSKHYSQIRKSSLVDSNLSWDKPLPNNVKFLGSVGLSKNIDEPSNSLKELSNDLHEQSSNNFSGVFYVSDNRFVEYEDFYLEQKSLSQNDQRYLLPSSESTIHTENWNNNNNSVIEAGYSLTFDKKKVFIYVKNHIKLQIGLVTSLHIRVLNFLAQDVQFPPNIGMFLQYFTKILNLLFFLIVERIH